MTDDVDFPPPPSPPCTAPLFLQTFWNKTCATFTWLLYIMAPLVKCQGLFNRRRFFLTTLSALLAEAFVRSFFFAPPPIRLLFIIIQIKLSLCPWPLSLFSYVLQRLFFSLRSYSISCECLSAHVVRIDTCFMYLPGKAIFQITLRCAHSTFLFQRSYISSAFWPALSPRQFSHRKRKKKSAESAKLFHLEVELEVLKGLACNSLTVKIL